MDGPMTILTNPEDNEEKKFAFDYSYWSHDGGEEDGDGYIAPAPGNNQFADQVDSHITT